MSAREEDENNEKIEKSKLLLCLQGGLAIVYGIIAVFRLYPQYSNKAEESHKDFSDLLKKYLDLSPSVKLTFDGYSLEKWCLGVLFLGTGVGSLLYSLDRLYRVVRC